LRALAPRGFFAAGLNNAERAVAASTSYRPAAHARLCLMLRRVHGLGWPMQQNGQTDRSSIVSRLQEVVGKDCLVMCIKQCRSMGDNANVFPNFTPPTLEPAQRARLLSAFNAAVATEKGRYQVSLGT
jgi:hypothetical protein